VQGDKIAARMGAPGCYRSGGAADG